MDLLSFAGLSKNIEIYVIGWAIGMARITGLMIVMPAFTRLGLTGILRTCVALVFSIPLMSYVVVTLPPETTSFLQLAPILFKEVMVGVVIGIVLGIPIWAVEVAGEILDLQRGVTFAEITDPSFVGHSNITATFFSVIIVALYFISGGLGITLRAIYESYHLWPLENFLPVLSKESGKLFLDLLDDIFGMGLMLVVPIVISMLLSDLSLALVARAAPHMNIFVLSLIVKNLTFSLFLVLYGAFLMSYMRDDLATILNFSDKLRRFAPG
jgi:type III secretion protein T